MAYSQTVGMRQAGLDDATAIHPSYGSTMPSSSVRTFTDAANYGAAIRAGHFDVMVVGRGAYRAKLVRIDLHHLWMQRFSENLPRIARAATSPARAIVSFPIGLRRRNNGAAGN